MAKGVLSISMLLIMVLSFPACSKRTISFVGEPSLFAGNELHPASSGKMEFQYLPANSLRPKQAVVRKGSPSGIRTKTPIFFRPALPIAHWQLAYPGETLWIGETEHGVITYHTRNVKRNKELNCARALDSLYFIADRAILKKFYSTDSPLNPNQSTVKNEIHTTIRDLTAKKKQILDSLSTGQTFSDHFLRNKIFEIQADSLAKTCWLYEKFSPPAEDRQGWTANCRECIQGFDSLSRQDGFFFYARSSIDGLCYSLIKAHGLNRQLGSTADFISYFNLIRENFSGDAENYLLSDLMYNAASKRIDIPEQYVSNYFESVKNGTYRAEVKQQLQQQKNLAAIAHTPDRNDLLAISSRAKTTVDEVIAQEKGHVVLLDFWASWCVPCRDETPHLKALVENYKGKKFKVVKISLDREIEKWERASANEGFTANNYLLLDIRQSAIVTRNNIVTIPRFMLIDKDGHIAAAEAPAPSSSGLKPLIDKLLSQSHEQ